MLANKLTTLPEAVCQLTNLYRLGLKGNQIQALPDSFGNLQNLVELFLTDNALKTLPESMQGCTALVKLQVCACIRVVAMGTTNSLHPERD
jgi:Leucine-rich repeat (LRR) protein